MPTVPPNTPTRVFTFSDIDFEVPTPYAAGRALTAPEAGFLNSAVASRVGNGYGGEVRRALTAINADRQAAFKAKTLDESLIAVDDKGKRSPVPATIADLRDDDGEPWDHAARFAERYESFIVGESNRGKGGASAASDPISRLMRTLASEDLKARIIAKGLSVQAFMRAKVTDADGEEVSKFETLLTANLEAQDERFRSMAAAQLAALKEGDADAAELDLTL